MAWDVNQVQMLEKLWKEGLSASQIARQLGGGITRNAVIGKVHRMGFAERGQPSRGGKSGGRRPTAPRMGKPARAASQNRHTPPPLPTLQPAAEDVHILDLADHKCRWPMGDPQDQENFRFCGARKLHVEKVYCEYHTHVAYQRSNRILAAQEAEKSKMLDKVADAAEMKKSAKASSGG